MTQFCWWKQIKGASPEMVEYIGMKNLITAVKKGVGLRHGKLVFGFEGMPLQIDGAAPDTLIDLMGKFSPLMI